jgi:hypothetical protein
MDDSVVRMRAEAVAQGAARSGLRSDWGDSQKVHDFAALACASRDLLSGSTVETGVFEGGTSAVLMASAPAPGFHVGIDPFGFPGQAYSESPAYEDWGRVRRTLRQLHDFAERSDVTYVHYATSSFEFCTKDLLPAVGQVALVHLDGDHSHEAVAQELHYFTTKVAPPVVYVLDDHDDHFPGVEAAICEFVPSCPGFHQIFHKLYDWSPDYGLAGFSAWLHTG